MLFGDIYMEISAGQRVLIGMPFPNGQQKMKNMKTII